VFSVITRRACTMKSQEAGHYPGQISAAQEIGRPRGMTWGRPENHREARKAVETSGRGPAPHLQDLLGYVIGGAKVFLGVAGGQRYRALADKVQDSADNALVVRVCSAKPLESRRPSPRNPQNSHNRVSAIPALVGASRMPVFLELNR
jgi:hypothetical protein